MKWSPAKALVEKSPPHTTSLHDIRPGPNPHVPLQRIAAAGASRSGRKRRPKSREIIPALQSFFSRPGATSGAWSKLRGDPLPMLPRLHFSIGLDSAPRLAFHSYQCEFTAGFRKSMHDP